MSCVYSMYVCGAQAAFQFNCDELHVASFAATLAGWLASSCVLSVCFNVFCVRTCVVCSVRACVRACVRARARSCVVLCCVVLCAQPRLWSPPPGAFTQRCWRTSTSASSRKEAKLCVMQWCVRGWRLQHSHSFTAFPTFPTNPTHGLTHHDLSHSNDTTQGKQRTPHAE